MRAKLYALVLLLIISCSPKERRTPELMDCVPQNTLAILQLKDQNMLVNTLTHLSFLEKTIQINSLLYAKAKSVLPQNINAKSLLIFTPEGKSEMAVSFISKKTESDSLPSVSLSQMEYNGVIIDIQNSEEFKTFAATINGINIKSTSQLILENSIRNIQDNKPGIQAGVFYDLAKIGDENAPLSLLIHRDFKTVLTETFPTAPLFPGLSKSWMSFDFNTTKTPFTLNGVSFLNDSLPDALSLLKELQPLTLRSPDVAPQNFDGFLALAVDDYMTLEDNFKQYSRHENIPLQKIDFSILSIIDEMAWITSGENKALIIHLRNTDTPASPLYPQNEPTANFRNTPVYSHTLPDAILQFGASFASSLNVKFVSPIDDFLVFSESETFLKQIIGNYLDGSTLARNLNYKNATLSLADESTFLWLGKTENLRSQWKMYPNTKDWEKISLKKYPLIVLQGVSESGFVQLHFTLQIDNPEQQQNSISQQYTFALDTTAIRPPQWLKNHRNKTMDIALQDQNNVLYLFSNTGNLLWKKALPGPIVGTIEQVDLYKNKRLQLAFRTADRFMILDRNGKVVSPFDIKVNGSAPQHLSVFDYDLNYNYRFLLTQGKAVKMLDNRGNNVNGFQLKTLTQALQHPPKHIRIGTRDYIVLQDVDGKVRLIDRIGKDRVRLKSPLTTSENQIYDYRSTFAGTTVSGDLFQIDTNGNVVLQPLGLATDHSIDMTSKSIVTLSENKLNIKGIPVILPFGNYTAPQMHYINNTIIVTLTDKDAQKVYAYYSDGKAVGGFPVFGTGVAALSNSDEDKAIEMVVQSESNSFIIYQIN